MRRWVAALALLAGCAATTVAEVPRSRVPLGEFVTDLPARPDERPLDPDDNWAIAVDEVPSLGVPGLCMSLAKARRAAEWVVSYNELRGLYEIDLRVWPRIESDYQDSLMRADEEVEAQRKKAVRSWFELHQGQIALVSGFVLGALVTTGIVAAASRADD